MATTMGSGRGPGGAGAMDRLSAVGSGATGHKSKLGRVGLLGKGVLYAVVGVLALQLATGDAARADERGAVAWIAHQPLGRFLLVVFTVSLFALALWQLIEVFTGDPAEGDGAKERLKFAVSGLAYLALAVFALTVTVDEWGRGGGSAGGGASGGSGGAGSGEQEATGTVLQWPAGRWIVAAVGLAVIAVSVYVIKHHVIDRSFVDRLRVGDGHWSVRLGQLGYGARSVAYGIIGVFLVQAAAAYDAEEAKGLSGALQELSGSGWGQAVLWFVALGLLAYGLYCFAESHYRRSA